MATAYKTENLAKLLPSWQQVEGGSSIPTRGGRMKWQFSEVPMAVGPGQSRVGIGPQKSRRDVYVPASPTENLMFAIADMIDVQTMQGGINPGGEPKYAELRDIQSPEQKEAFSSLLGMLQAEASGVMYGGQRTAPISTQEQTLIEDVLGSYGRGLAAAEAGTERVFPEDYYETVIAEPLREQFRKQTIPDIQEAFAGGFDSSLRQRQIREAGTELETVLERGKAELARQEETFKQNYLALQQGYLGQAPQMMQVAGVPRGIAQEELNRQYEDFVRAMEQGASNRALLGQLTTVDLQRERSPIHPDYYREDPGKFVPLATTAMTVEQRERESRRAAETAQAGYDVTMRGQDVTARGQDIQRGVAEAEMESRQFLEQQSIDIQQQLANLQEQRISQDALIEQQKIQATTSQRVAELIKKQEELDRKYTLEYDKLMQERIQNEMNRQAALQRSQVSAYGGAVASALSGTGLGTHLPPGTPITEYLPQYFGLGSVQSARDYVRTPSIYYDPTRGKYTYEGIPNDGREPRIVPIPGYSYDYAR